MLLKRDIFEIHCKLFYIQYDLEMSKFRSKSITEISPCVIYHETVKDKFDMGIFVPKGKLSTEIKIADSYINEYDMKEYGDDNKQLLLFKIVQIIFESG